MAFYSDVKEHCSPSALDNWLNSKASFIKNYFAGEKGPETKAMTAGTQIHALVEAGVFKAQKVFDRNEHKLLINVNEMFKFLGVPDSYTSKTMEDENAGSYAEFVDYKSGKSNGWVEKLPTDIKMKATAWLVWKDTGCPDMVFGHIEYIQTMYDPETRTVVPVEGKETEVISITYTREELEAFTKVIEREMSAVNEEYERWKSSTGEFVNQQDVERYVALRNEIEQKEVELEEIGNRIQQQMEFGGEEHHKTSFGTFSMKCTKTYEYPMTLKINYLDMGLMLDDADQIAAAAKAAKKNFELVNDPVSTTRKVQFRPARTK